MTSGTLAWRINCPNTPIAFAPTVGEANSTNLNSGELVLPWRTNLTLLMKGFSCVPAMSAPPLMMISSASIT